MFYPHNCSASIDWKELLCIFIIRIAANTWKWSTNGDQGSSFAFCCITHSFCR